MEALVTKGLKANFQTSFVKFCVNILLQQIDFNICHTICCDYFGTFPASKNMFLLKHKNSA